VMTEQKKFTAHEARGVGEQIGIDWEKAAFDVEQFRMGIGRRVGARTRQSQHQRYER
jgi:hypothetical protein